MKKTIAQLVPVLLLIAFVLSACASAAPAPSLDGTSWKLISYGPVANQVPALLDKDLSLAFDTRGTLSGNAGCNGFSGDFKLEDGKLTTGKMMSTLMACADPLMQQEGAVLSTLDGTLKYELVNDMLKIYSADGQNLLIFAKH